MEVLTSFAVLEEVIAEKPDKGQAFANAMTKAMVFGHQDPEGAAAVAVERYADSDPEIITAAAKRTIAQGAYPTSLMVSDQS